MSGQCNAQLPWNSVLSTAAAGTAEKAENPTQHPPDLPDWRPDERHRPCSLIGAGYAAFVCRSLPDKNRGRAGRQRSRAHSSPRKARKQKVLGPADLATSRQRGVSKSVKPQVRQTQGVPRAVFLGLLRSAPGGLTFQAVSCARHAYPPLEAQVGSGKACDRPPARHHGARWRAVGAPGQMRLGPPGRLAASPAWRHSPATAPRPASEDAVQTPLGKGRDMRYIVLYHGRNVVLVT